MLVYVVVGERLYVTDETETENVKAFVKKERAEKLANELKSKYNDTWVEALELN